MPPKGRPHAAAKKVESSGEVPFATYLEAEARRQCNCGIDVPEGGEPLQVWQSEACFRWARANPKLSAEHSVAVTPLLRHARNQLTTDEGEKLLEQFNAAVTDASHHGTNAPPPAAVSDAVDQKRELLATLESFELCLRMFFADPMATHSHLEKIVRRLKEPIATLRNEGIIAYAPSCFPELSVLFEIACYRRLRTHWSELSSEMKKKADEGALQLCELFDAPEYKDLAAAICDPAATTPTIIQLVDAAAQGTKLSMPHLLSNVRAVFPSARPPRIAIAHIADAADDAAHAPAPADDERQSSASTVTTPGDDATTTSQPRGSPFNIVGDRLFGGCDGVERADKVKRVEAGQCGTTVGEVLGLPVPTATSTSTATKTARLLLGPRTTMSATAAVRPVAGAAAATHRYPCRSRYHAKYSFAEKHGSAECCFCTVCHMMEFLFNGCTRDCCWKHAPTDRKISMHLSGHPEVFKKATEQFTEFRTRGRAAPLAIPL